jgi:hypothetical protein
LHAARKSIQEKDAMAATPSAVPPRPRPPIRHLAIRFNPDDSHPLIAELCERERSTHERGEHEHIDFIPRRAA